MGIKKSAFNTICSQCKVEHTVFTYLTVSCDYAHDMCCISVRTPAQSGHITLLNPHPVIQTLKSSVGLHTCLNGT